MSRRFAVAALLGVAWLLGLSATASAARGQHLNADLALTQSVSPSSVGLDGIVTFKVTLTDLGRARATGVSVQDKLPAGFTFVSSKTSEGLFTSTTGLWKVGSVTTTTAETLTIRARVRSQGPGANTAKITHSDQFDPRSSNNHASASVKVTAPAVPPVQTADLAVSNTVSPSTANVGDTVTFTIKLTDNGPDTATGVAVQAVLPSGYTFVSATASEGSYSTNIAEWTVGTVTTAASQTLVLTAKVASPNPGTTAATITHADQLDPNGANNTSSASVQVNVASGDGGAPPQTADLALTQAASPSVAGMGTTVSFTLTLSNNGPNTASNVTVQDSLPGTFAFVSATPSEGTYNQATGVWTVGTVPTGSPQTLLIAATVTSAPPATNTATITHADQSDPDSSNNSASATVAGVADLGLTQAVSNSTPNVGDTITFTVTLSDAGPAPATNVQVQDSVPSGLTFVGATPSQGTYTSATGVWTVGTVTSTPQLLLIQATVGSASAQTNTATISHSDEIDPNTANNTASVTETPQQADLALTKGVSNPTPNLGDIITLTVSLTSNGPDTATHVTVQDLLPAGLSLVSATPSQGTYAGGIWTVGTVSSTQTLSIQALVNSPIPQTNTATISHSDQFDPNPTNNTASATETPRADLALTKSVSDSTPNVGDTVTFTITVNDLSPSPATNVAVQDLLPSGLTLVTSTPSEGIYNPGTGQWTVGIVSAPQTLQIQALVNSPNAQTNTATISHSDQFDPNTGNNNASVTVTPQQADLALTKGVSNPTPNVGDTITFTLSLTNNGPNTATHVVVQDTLPPGLTFVSSTPSQGAYDSTSGQWSVGTVASTPQTLFIQATVVSPAAQTNTATIFHSDQFDPISANNAASVTVTPQQADLALTKSVSDSTPNVGDTVTFTVTLTNNGPDAATNVAVTDVLPGGLSLVSATPSQGTYAGGVWTVGTVAATSMATLGIQATVVSPSAQTNTATISHSDQFDPITANNAASVTVTPQQAELALGEIVSNPTPTVGETITFTVSLTNNGPDTATNVTVQDLVPAGLSLVSATPSQGTYAGGTWTVGTVSSTQTLAIQAMVTSASAQTNTATVSHSDQFDPNPGNNSASATETPT